MLGTPVAAPREIDSGHEWDGTVHRMLTDASTSGPVGSPASTVRKQLRA